MKALTLTANKEKLNEVLSFVDEELELLACPPRKMMQVDIAVEEIFINVASYAYAPGEGPVVIRLETEENPLTLKITFEDHGVPYNPLQKDDPDITLSAEERQIGGLGIFMVKKSMDDMIYQYKDKTNILTLVKILE